MAKTETAPDQLTKGAKVVARVDLRDVPAGTTGRVSMVTGLSWIRYWVRFDNGVSLGTIDRKRLATPEQWKRHLAGEEDLSGERAGPADEAADGGDGGDDGGAGKATPNGTVVPQKLLERSAAARARLGG
jgi:hypothetical protein